MQLFAINFSLFVFVSIFGVESRVKKKPPIESRKWPLRRYEKCVDSCDVNFGEECYLVPVTETKMVASKCIVKCYFDLEVPYENLETCLCWKNRCVAKPLKRKMPGEEEKQPTEDQTPKNFRFLKKAERRLLL